MFLDRIEPTTGSDPSAGFRAALASDTIANNAAAQALVSEQEQGPPDRPSAEMPARDDAARNDGADGAAMPAPVTADGDHQELGRCARLAWASELALPDPMPHQAQWASDRPRSCPAPRALSGPSDIRRWRGRAPKLDVNLRMNDMNSALGLSQNFQEHDEARERLVTYFVASDSPMLRLRSAAL